MSLEVFKTMDLSAETKNCSLCGVCSEDILCHQITICTELRYQRQDLVNKLFQLLGHSKCTELLQLDEFKSVTSSEAMTLKLLHIQLIFSPLVELFFWTVDYNYKPLLSDFEIGDFNRPTLGAHPNIVSYDDHFIHIILPVFLKPIYGCSEFTNQYQ
jgi:hypothetical protein